MREEKEKNPNEILDNLIQFIEKPEKLQEAIKILNDTIENPEG